MIRVSIVEDNATIRTGLRALIDATEGFACRDCFRSCEQLLASLGQLAVDVILMDIGLPGMSGIEGVRHVKEQRPEIQILILTVYEDNDRIFAALQQGASGYMIKKTPPVRLLEAIREAHEGGAPMNAHIARKVVSMLRDKRPKAGSATVLTEREKQILEGLADGAGYKAIAARLTISVDTVRFHIRNVYQKLHVHSQSHAVATALRRGLI